MTKEKGKYNRQGDVTCQLFGDIAQEAKYWKTGENGASF
jgi:hypothetical protein